MTRLFTYLTLCALALGAGGLLLGGDARLCAVVGVLVVAALLGADMAPSDGRHSVR